MRKGAKWVLGIFVLLFVGFIVLSLTGTIKLFPQEAIGSSLISLSQVNLESSYAPLNGQAWVMSFTLGGMGNLGQYYKYRVAPEEAGALYSGVEQPVSVFTLDAKLDEQSCVYNINQDNDLQRIYSYNVVHWSYGVFQTLEGTSSGKCGNSKMIIAWTQGGFAYGGNAICQTEKAVAGRFGSPNVNSKFTISVSKDGVVDASQSFQTLFSDGGSFGVKGLVGNNVYVNWQGDLVSGKSCPSSNGVTPVYYQGSWTPVGTANYETYRIKYVDLNTWVSSQSYKNYNQAQAQEFVDGVNSASDNALSGRNFGSIDNASSFASAQAKVVLSSAITYPVITAYVKASWIGVVTPIGKPKIISATIPCFSSSSDGNIKLVVQNVGAERETFLASGTCVDSSFVIQNSDVFVNAGDSKTVYLVLSGETSKSELKSSCTINVKGTAYSDSKVITACVSGISICDAGMLYCDQKNLMKCNDGGTALGLLQACTDTCTINSSTGIAQCKGFVPPDTCGNGVCNGSETKESCALDCQPACASTVFGLVPASVGVKESCDFLCTIGLKGKEDVNVCVKDYTPLILVILTVLILGGMVLYASMKGKGKSKGGKKSNVFTGKDAIWRKKAFWIVLVVLGIIFFIANFIKFFFWAIVVLIVLSILFGIVFRRSIFRKIKRKIER